MTELEYKKKLWKAPDYSQLKERDFNRVLDEIRDLVELEAVANRRKHLGAPQLTAWNEWQRAAILRRKYELQRDG